MEEPIKDLAYWRANAEDNFTTTPISVMRYIIELEELTNETLTTLRDIHHWINNHEEWWMDCPNKGGYDLDKIESLINKKP